MPKMPKPLPPKPEPGNRPGIVHTPVSAETDAKIKAIYTQLYEDLSKQLHEWLLNLKVDGGEIN